MKICSLLIVFNVMLLFVFQAVHSRPCCGQITQNDLDAGNGVFTIDKSGTHKLVEPIIGKIVIDADDVVFNLCNNKITNMLEYSYDKEGIVVTENKKNIIIKNGVVESTDDRGIVVHGNTDCCGPRLENLRVQKCGCEAVLFDGVTNGHIIDCEFIASFTGLVLNQSTQVVVQDTVASCNALAGFALHASSNNCFTKCRAFANGGEFLGSGGTEAKITGNIDRFGFVSTDGCGNVFQECCAENNTIPPLDSTDFCRSVAGFAFVGTETCSKIIDCKSENNWAPYQFDVFETHSLVKSATPYGILLKSQLHVVGDKELELVVAVDPGDEAGDGDKDDIVYAVDWSPDGKYLAVGGDIIGTDNKDLRVYTFDPAAHTPLTFFAAVNPGDEAGGGVENDIVYSVDWSPDGKYLAVGGRITGPNNSFLYLNVYSFDPSMSNPLTLLINEQDEFESTAQYGYSVDWSPNGKYLAVGGRIDYQSHTGNEKDLRVYSFDGFNLTLIASVNPAGGSLDDTVWSVNWSPDGCFLAMGGDVPGEDEKTLRVYSFDLSASDTLVLVAAVDPGREKDVFQVVYSVEWSPDGKYLAMGGEFRNTDVPDPVKDLKVYAFDLTVSSTLTLVAAVDPGDEPGGPWGYSDRVRSVNWSPDGQYLAMGGRIRDYGGNQASDLRVYKALSFPTKNVIKRNIVACNCIRAQANADECGCDLDVCPKGVGISGTSICNMIMENESYNNPFNYQFVTNVFDQRFGNMPSLLQNIALGGCEPVCIPCDCGRLARENNILLSRVQELIKTLSESLFQAG